MNPAAQTSLPIHGSVGFANTPLLLPFFEGAAVRLPPFLIHPPDQRPVDACLQIPTGLREQFQRSISNRKANVAPVALSYYRVIHGLVCPIHFLFLEILLSLDEVLEIPISPIVGCHASKNDRAGGFLAHTRLYYDGTMKYVVSS